MSNYKNCVTHSHACDCREHMFKEKERVYEELKTQCDKLVDALDKSLYWHHNVEYPEQAGDMSSDINEADNVLGNYSKWKENNNRINK